MLTTRGARHYLNVQWVNAQIRICLLARRLLRNDKPSDYYVLIWHCDTNGREDLRPLKALVFGEHKDFYQVRFENYNMGLLAKVFDIRKWIFEARSLRWKAPPPGTP